MHELTKTVLVVDSILTVFFEPNRGKTKYKVNACIVYVPAPNSPVTLTAQQQATCFAFALIVKLRHYIYDWHT